MKIDDLIRLAENRLMTLNNEQLSATTRGDVDEPARLEAAVGETEATLASLRSLPA